MEKEQWRESTADTKHSEKKKDASEEINKHTVRIRE